jgi:hypothetical protein
VFSTEEVAFLDSPVGDKTKLLDSALDVFPVIPIWLVDV